jgi:hypothetical protein
VMLEAELMRNKLTDHTATVLQFNCRRMKRMSKSEWIAQTVRVTDMSYDSNMDLFIRNDVGVCQHMRKRDSQLHTVTW